MSATGTLLKVLHLPGRSGFRCSAALTICTGSLRLSYQQLDLPGVEAGADAVSNAATPPALVLSRAFLRKEDLRLQLTSGVTATVCGVILLLVA
jgi:hypothetical protein